MKYRAANGHIKEVLVASEIPTDEVSSVLIDMHSLKPFAKEAQFGRLGNKRYVNSLRSELNDSDEDTQESIRQLLEFLAYFICFDKIILDARALQAFDSGHRVLDAFDEFKIGDTFSFLAFPSEAYVLAGLKAFALKHQIQTKTVSDISKGDYIKQLLQLSGLLDDGDDIFKSMCDGYWNHQFLEPRLNAVFNIGNTGESAERLLVYLEVANMFGIQATLSRAKYAAAAELGVKLQTIFEGATGEMELHKSGLDSVQSAVLRAVMPGHRIGVPPLPGHILDVASDRGCSLIDAAKWLRASPGAIDFRRWLRENGRFLRPVSCGEKLRNQTLEQELAEIGNRIRHAQDPSGIFKTNWLQNVTLTNIPLLDTMLPPEVLAELSKIKFRIPLKARRNPPLYEIFIASWFSTDAKPLAH